MKARAKCLFQKEDILPQDATKAVVTGRLKFVPSVFVLSAQNPNSPTECASTAVPIMAVKLRNLLKTKLISL
jgi:hypothetical protein